MKSEGESKKQREKGKREREKSRVLIVSHGGGATVDRLAGLPSYEPAARIAGKGVKRGERQRRKGRANARAVLRR